MPGRNIFSTAIKTFPNPSFTYVCCMKNTARPVLIRFILGAVLVLVQPSGFAQINQSVTAVKFGLFNITSARKQVNDNYVLYITISKGNQFILADSVVTDAATCQGFSFPTMQPFKDYFIFSKHAKHAGRTYILTKAGDFAMIGGGAFWACSCSSCR